jgi:transcription elongation factor Elf1
MKSKNGCPFCNHFVIQIVKSAPSAMTGLQAECDNCGARGPIYETKKDALLGWERGIVEENGRQRKC